MNADQVPHDGAWDGAGDEDFHVNRHPFRAYVREQSGADEALAQIVEVRSKASASVVWGCPPLTIVQFAVRGPGNRNQPSAAPRARPWATAIEGAAVRLKTSQPGTHGTEGRPEGRGTGRGTGVAVEVGVGSGWSQPGSWAEPPL